MDILISGLRTQPGLIEVRGRSPEGCSDSVVRVSVTIAGDSEAAYEGVALVPTTAASGYRPWTAIATTTLAYAAAGRADPPCGLDLIVQAQQGSCTTKPDPDPITLRCCATIEELATQLSPCDANRTRTITATFRVSRQHEGGEISVLAHLRSSTAGAFIPAAQTRTLALHQDTLTFSVVFSVATPAETDTVAYSCTVERVTAGKCHDETLATAFVDVGGCPCFAEPGDLTVHTVDEPHDALPASQRDGMPCYAVARVRVHAPDFGDAELSWDNATAVDPDGAPEDRRAAVVALPADGSEVTVIAHLGSGPCQRTRTLVLRRCLDCSKLKSLDFDEACQPDGRNLVTLSANIEPDSAGAFAWNFGDGSAPETGPLPTVSHFYEGAPGAFSVTVTFTPADASCSADSLTRTITLAECPCPKLKDLTVTNELCLAALDGTALGISQATFETTTDPQDADGTFSWDFGDGSAPETTRLPLAAHAYSSGGARTVTVTFQPDRARCAPAPLQKRFTVQQCNITPPIVIDNCCLFLLIVTAMAMAVGAFVFPLGLCPLAMGEWRSGLVITGTGAVIVLAGLLLLLFWTLWCATLRVNCWLIELALDILIFLAACSGIATVVAFVITFVAKNTCLAGITGGAAFDTAYFAVLAFLMQWMTRICGCRPYPPWVPAFLQISVPNWLNIGLNYLRGLLPPCPL